MRTIHKNIKEDFKVLCDLGAGYAGEDFVLHFFAGNNRAQKYTCSYIGGVYKNCAKVQGEDSVFLLLFNNHGLGVGQITIEEHRHVTDNQMPDKVLHLCSVKPFVCTDSNGNYSVEITRGKSDTTQFTMEALLLLPEITKGDPFTYEDFTAEQIAALKKPATDAAATANAAATAANTAAAAANAAAARIPDTSTFATKTELQAKANQTDLTAIGSKVGNLENLQTTDKTSIVNALNEVRSQGGGGTEQIQSDWQQTDTTAKDYIKNKPTIPTTDGLETSAHASATYATKTEVQAKQDAINDLQTIREGAALGATALQSHQSLAAYETSEHASATYQAKGNYLTDAPTDGKQYARKDGTWAEVQGGGGAGIPETEVVTITLKTNSGVAMPSKTFHVTIDGNDVRTLTTDAQGKATLNVSGGSTYTITPDGEDGYVASEQTYTACKATRNVEIVYYAATTEHVIVKVRRAVSDVSASALYLTQKVIFTNVTSGDVLEYPLDASDNFEIDVQLGVTYSVSATDLDGYTMAAKTFVASKYSRTIVLYYRPTDSGIYLIHSDGTELKTDTETDYSDYSRKNEIVALGIRTSNLIKADTSFAFCVQNMLISSFKIAPSTTAVPGLKNYSLSTTDLDGEYNTQCFVSAYPSGDVKTKVVDKTIQIGDETKNFYVPSIGQLVIIRDNLQEILRIYSNLGLAFEINNTVLISSTQYSTNTYQWSLTSSWGSPGYAQKTSVTITLPIFKI